MKRLFCVSKGTIIVIVSCFFTANHINAQSNGILPLTGLRYFAEGISVKNIDVKIDGSKLLSNRIPLDKEIEIALQETGGFIPDNNKNSFAGAEVLVLSPRGEVLSNLPNILAKNLSTGFTAKELASFNIKFAVAAALVKSNFNGTVKIRLYDLKGKSQMRFELPVTFARPGERLQISRAVAAIKSENAVNGMISGLQVKNMKVDIDNSITVSPKMAYTSVDLSQIKGSSLSGIFEGKENFWVYDNNLNEVKITDMLLKKVKGAMENDAVDYTLKIPYRLKTMAGKQYTVRFRWESPDKSQIIDFVVTI